MALGIGILGTGGIATHGLAAAVNAVKDANRTAVLSRDRCREAVFAQRFGIPEVHDNLDALLHSPNVQAVIVATPDASHKPQVIAAARAGVHGLCEKPMTTTYAGGQRLAEAVRASGITFLFRRANWLDLPGDSGDIVAENLFGNWLDGQWMTQQG